MSEATHSRILGVEDDLHLAEGLAENMRAEGYAADTAHDGKLGLEKALADDYDLMVLDVMLPRRDGWSVLGAMRRWRARARGPMKSRWYRTVRGCHAQG